MVVKICIGNIASGKSTFCKQRATEGYVILNDDAIVNMLHGGDYTLYQKSWKPLYKSIENHIFYAAITAGRSVVIDRGVDVRRGSRKRWIALANSVDVGVVAVVFPNDLPEVHARRRAESDGRGHDYDYWLSVARNFDKAYDLPEENEGFDSIEMVEWKPVND